MDCEPDCDDCEPLGKDGDGIEIPPLVGEDGAPEVDGVDGDGIPLAELGDDGLDGPPLICWTAHPLIVIKTSINTKFFIADISLSYRQLSRTKLIISSK